MSIPLYDLRYSNDIVDEGVYNKTRFVIKTLGYYPVVYIGYNIPEEIAEELKEESGIELTYRSENFDKPLDGLDPDYQWVGWDYAHIPYDYYVKYNKSGQKHAIKGILKDIIYVIQFLIEKGELLKCL